jgi:hypothetical protein
MSKQQKQEQPAHRPPAHHIPKTDYNEWFEKQILSRIPLSFGERLAATNDPAEIDRLLTTELKRIIDEIRSEGERTDFEELRKPK